MVCILSWSILWLLRSKLDIIWDVESTLLDSQYRRQSCCVVVSVNLYYQSFSGMLRRHSIVLCITRLSNRPRTKYPSEAIPGREGPHPQTASSGVADDSRSAKRRFRCCETSCLPLLCNCLVWKESYPNDRCLNDSVPLPELCKKEKK